MVQAACSPLDPLVCVHHTKKIENRYVAKSFNRISKDLPIEKIFDIRLGDFYRSKMVQAACSSPGPSCVCTSYKKDRKSLRR
jgi:hypothetical protein